MLEVLAATKKKGLSRKDGPFIRNLDATLATFNVHRQAYYSGTFVGNHVHRTLKVSTKVLNNKFHNTHQEVNVKTLCESVPEFARARCPQLQPNAQFVSTTFAKVFSAFGKCHSVYDCSETLSDDQLENLG